MSLARSSCQVRVKEASGHHIYHRAYHSVHTMYLCYNVRPRTGQKGPQGERRYSSTLSLTSVLDECGWSTPRTGRFTPGRETRHPFYTRGWVGPTAGMDGRGKSRPPPPRFDPRTVQLYRLRYPGPLCVLCGSQNKQP